MTSPFSPLSIKQLYSLEIPPVEWAVEGLLPLGSAVLLSAREKSGKGLLTIDLCGCIALEEPFLDLPVSGGPAIYCPAEESVRLVRDRVRERFGNRVDAPLHVLRLDGSTDDKLDLEVVESLVRLDTMMADIRPTLVVIDTLREIHRGRENESDDMAPLLKPLRQLAHQHHAVILVNHHMSKLGSSRGSTAIPAAFDQVITFTRDDSENTTISGELRVEGRDVARRSLRVVYGAGGRFALNHAAPIAAEVDTRSRILNLLPHRPEGMTAAGIADTLGTSLKTVQNLLSTMKGEEVLPFIVTGGQRKGSPSVYRPIAPLPIRPERSGNVGNDFGNDSSDGDYVEMDGAA